MKQLLTSRRQALKKFGLASCSGLLWSVPTSLWGQWFYLSKPSETPPGNAEDDRLRNDLARLAPRAYSEEGIPVFLACINLAPTEASSKAAKAALPPFSAALAANFRRNAEAFQRIRPNAKARDVAPLIEVLADRDFSVGTTTEAF